MKIFKDIGEIEPALKLPVLTVGNFDGVHIGHQRIIKLVVDRAREIKGTSVLMTFDPHPRTFFDPEFHSPMITTLKQRIELIERLGIDVVIIQPFTKSFAELQAEDFILKLLVKQLGVSELYVSRKFRFGRNAQGDVDLLKVLAGEYGFRLLVAENVQFRHTFVSSSFVRRVILNGEMDLAMRLLGRPYRITGTVYRDTRRGTELLNCPTSNIRPENELIPTTGIYAAAVCLDDLSYPSAAYIGSRPTFNGEDTVIETHMMDFSGTLYTQNIALEFYKKIRDDMKFDSVEELRAAIEKDLEQIRAFFQRHTGDPDLPPLSWSEGAD